jgi:hypothetical protein
MNSKIILQFAICNLQLTILCLLLSSASTVLAATPTTVPIDGKPFQAELAEIDDDGSFVFSSEGKTQKLPQAELVSWGTPVEPRRGPLVVLEGGGLLAADILGADKDRLDVDTELFGRLKLPLEHLCGAIFHLPGSARERDRLIDRLASAEGDSDRVLLENGDELAGTLEEIDDRSAKLRTENGPASVELTRVEAIVFNPQLRSKPDEKSPRTWIGFNDGSRLMASNISPLPLGEGQGVRAERSLKFTALGQSLKTPLKNVVFLQPLSGRAIYLSQLKPTDYRHVPYLSIAWPYRIDRNVKDDFLRAGGRLHLKGIGMHSAARLNYALPPGAKRFQAEAAIDDAADGGSVRFRVFVDGKEIFSSPVVRGGMPPVPIDLDVSGGKQLDLVVDYADRADVQDWSDWLDARVIAEK